MTQGTPPITSFSGPYRVLSSFAETPFYLPLLDLRVLTGEHGFQACKSDIRETVLWIASAPTAGEAKSRGRSVPLRDNWDRIKRWVMLQVVLSKFSVPALSAQLIATGDAELVEGNTWGDDYWGAVPGRTRDTWPPGMPGWQAPDGAWLAGYNWLGRILMMARETIAPET